MLCTLGVDVQKTEEGLSVLDEVWGTGGPIRTSGVGPPRPSLVGVRWWTVGVWMGRVGATVLVLWTDPGVGEPQTKKNFGL